jgi:transcription antitermination factor NusG
MPPDATPNHWQPGEIVRFLRPDLAGNSGVVATTLPDGRVMAEVTVFGRATMFELDPGELTTS